MHYGQFHYEITVLKGIAKPRLVYFLILLRLEVLDDLMSLLGLFFLREGWNTHPTLFNTYCSQSILQLLDTIFSCVSLGNGYYITNFGKTHYSIYNKN